MSITKMERARIKFDRLHTRSKKKTYKRLTETQHKIVKLTEKQERATKDIDQFWKYVCKYKESEIGTRMADNERTDWTLYHEADKRYESARKALSKYDDKNIENALEVFKQNNIGYCQSSSF